MSPKAKKIETKQIKKKKVVDPNAPKKGMTAFLHYVQDQRLPFKEANPELSHKEVISKLSEKWRELSENEKEPYEKKAKHDKEAFTKAKEAYQLKKKEEEAAKSSEKKENREEEDGNPTKKHKKSTEN